MTPDQARDLLNGTTPGPWEWRWDAGLLAVASDAGPVAIDVNEADAALVAAAPTLAAMIAGMREEWGVHVTGYPKNIADWWEICDTPEDRIVWHPDEDAAEDFATEREDDGYDTRIVRRYVTTPEEIA